MHTLWCPIVSVSVSESLLQKLREERFLFSFFFAELTKFDDDCEELSDRPLFGVQVRGDLCELRRRGGEGREEKRTETGKERGRKKQEKRKSERERRKNNLT